MLRMSPSAGACFFWISSAQSMALWIGRAQEYGLNSMRNSNGLSSLRTISAPAFSRPAKARRKPRSPSKMVSAPVKPRLAICAAVTPLRAAGPGLKRFCIDGPYISIRPEACAPASPKADVSFAGDSFSSLPAAAVAPNTPQVGVVWNARLRRSLLAAWLTRSITSQPAASAVISSLPPAPTASPTASAGENTGGLKWNSASTSMSSSSMLWQEIALANAAAAIGTRPLPPISVASAARPCCAANARATTPLSLWLPAMATPR